MFYFWLISGCLLALLWLDRLRDAATGSRNIADLTAEAWAKPRETLPRLSIIVPARNEAQNIESALRSVLALDYPDFEVILVNDRSTDATGAVIDRIASERRESSHAGCRTLEVIHLSELPPGWLGKPHAMWMAAGRATGEWLLFTDADVRFRPDALRRAVGYAESVKCGHLVLFPTHQPRSAGERMMLGAFSMLFVFGHRPWKVADPRTPDFMGLGAFNLLRRTVYEQIGTACALRMEVVEDMKLGKLVKGHGFTQRVAYGPGLVPWRWFSGTLGSVRVLKKNFFAGMNFNWAKAVSACFLLAFLTLTPFVGAIFAHGWARAGNVVALAAMFALYAGMARNIPISPFDFFLHPLATLLLIAAMVNSMAHVARNHGVVWRDTLYPLDELRKGLV